MAELWVGETRHKKVVAVDMHWQSCHGEIFSPSDNFFAYTILYLDLFTIYPVSGNLNSPQFYICTSKHKI